MFLTLSWTNPYLIKAIAGVSPDFDSAGPDDLQLFLPTKMSQMPWLLILTERVVCCTDSVAS